MGHIILLCLGVWQCYYLFQAHAEKVIWVSEDRHTALHYPSTALTTALSTCCHCSKRVPKTKTTATNSHVWSFCIKIPKESKWIFYIRNYLCSLAWRKFKLFYLWRLWLIFWNLFSKEVVMPFCSYSHSLSYVGNQGQGKTYEKIMSEKWCHETISCYF